MSTKIRFRSSTTGKFQSFGEWCQDKENEYEKHAYVNERFSPKEAYENIEQDEANYLKLKYLAEIIDKLDLPKINSIWQGGLTITSTGAWYGDSVIMVLEKHKDILNKNRRLSKLWAITEIE